MFRLAVAGAHLSGLPLNHQLTDLGAKLIGSVKTAPVYRMYDLGPKPSLVRQADGQGHELELEVWDLPLTQVGSFIRDGVKEPLAIGDILLNDGTLVKGFVGEAYAVQGLKDVSEYGGWRAYVAARIAGSS